MPKTKVKLLCLDVDGTLTDGMYFVSNNGECFKKFYTRDFYALEKMQNLGLAIVIITSSKDDCIIGKYNQLPDRCKKNMFVFTGIENKLEKIKQISQKWDIDASNIAYMGDFLNDLEVIEWLSQNGGITGCPYDACSEVKSKSEYVSSKNGGVGAVEDFCCYLETEL